MSDFTCARCKKDGPRLAGPPMPGPLGMRAYENVCNECWQAWLQYQTALINHYGLNLRDLQAREFLTKQSQAFFFEAHEPENFEATKPEGS